MSQSVQYMVRDAQGQEYGPADIATLRQWVRERRILAAMQIAVCGTQQWSVAGLHPQLADLFRAAAAATTGPPDQPQPPGTPGGYPATADQVPGAGGMPSGYPGQQTNPLAIASLVCSLVGVLGCCGVPSILGVIFGHIARGQIRRAPAQYSGDGLALAGLIIGYVATALFVVLLLVYVCIFAVAAAAPGHP